MATTILTHVARITVGLVVTGLAAIGTTGTALADAPPAELTVAGDVTGAVTHTSVACTPLGNGVYSWELKGQVNQAPVDITFNTNAFHGAGTYKATGVTDDHGGLVTLETGDVQVATDGDNLGTFTIDEGELNTGTIDTDLHNADNNQFVHIKGTWACS